MKRREFIALFGGAAAWSSSASGQTPGQAPLVAFLWSNRALRFIQMLQQSLTATGLMEGRDFRAASRQADGDLSRLPALAAELVQLKPSAIMTGVTSAAIAARNATKTIPIVCTQMIDPVGLGLVKSHARPGTNVTGILASLEGLPGKQLEILRQVVPTAKRIGMLVNVRNAQNPIQARDAQSAAVALGVDLVALEVGSANEITAAIQLRRKEIDALLVLADPVFYVEHRIIATLADAARLPTIYPIRDNVDDGGLISYAIDRRQSYLRAADLLSKILKGG